MSQIYYYIEKFTDEVVPCECSLQGWAAWLAKGGDRDEDPDGAWSFEPPLPGTTYLGSAMRMLPYVEVRRDDDGEVHFEQPLPAKFDFVACTDAEGGDWDADGILDPRDVEGGLAPEHGALIEPGESGYLAFGITEWNIRFQYDVDEAGTPQLTVVGKVQ